MTRRSSKHGEADTDPAYDEATVAFAPLLGADGELLRENFTDERLAKLEKLLARVRSDEFRPHDEREENRRAALARHPQGADLWVFGYGSLMWNPAVHVAETAAATIYGYHRAFCLDLEFGRGTADKPGLMLGLDRGGSCRGIAHRIAADLVESETRILWMREMMGRGYEPAWVSAATEAGRVPAVTFVANRTGMRYVGRLPHETMVTRIAQAEGAVGTNRDYLYRTVERLAALGIADGALHALSRDVRARAEG